MQDEQDDQDEHEVGGEIGGRKLRGKRGGDQRKGETRGRAGMKKGRRGGAEEDDEHADNQHEARGRGETVEKA